MDIKHSRSGVRGKKVRSIGRLYGLLAPRAYSVIIFAALFFTLAVKFFHGFRAELLNEYFDWIAADVSFLLALEVIMAVICFLWPRRWVIRTVVILAAFVCTWSVMSAGWLIRTGTQILPAVLLPLVRDPLNSLGIIGVNLVEMPVVAVALLGPSAIALTFFFFVMVRPAPPGYNRRRFVGKIVASIFVIVISVLLCSVMARQGSAQMVSSGLRYNSQLKAVTYLFSSTSPHKAKHDLENATREVPAFDQIKIALPKQQLRNYNVIVVVLEGIQYRYTSLYDKEGGLTPYLAALAEQGVEFEDARTTITHTTKALFGLMTGRFPSSCQDLVEAVPALKPYASIATIVKNRLKFRTAFFQSAKGNFESRPSLVWNLDFDKFWAREDLSDTSGFLGYLGCDEFLM